MDVHFAIFHTCALWAFLLHISDTELSPAQKPPRCFLEDLSSCLCKRSLRRLEGVLLHQRPSAVLWAIINHMFGFLVKCLCFHCEEHAVILTEFFALARLHGGASGLNADGASVLAQYFGPYPTNSEPCFWTYVARAPQLLTTL